MRWLACLAAIAFSWLAMPQSFASAIPSLVSGTPYPRPARLSVPARPSSLSGITWVGGSNYFAVADGGSPGEAGLYSIKLDLSPDGLSVVACDIAPTNECVRLVGARDLEDVAFDAANGTVWAVDESSGTVKEYSVTDGSAVNAVDMPDVLLDHRPNLGFESLALSGDGLTLWTCTEEALRCDGPRSSYVGGTNVRLVKFVRSTVRDRFVLAGMHYYATEKWSQRCDYGGRARRGVAALCALPDGSLLVLEREMSFGASDVLRALKTARLCYSIFHVSPLKEGKRLLVSGCGGVLVTGNYEGMCLGPELACGARSVLLVSDAGDGASPAMILPLVLRIGD